MPEDLIKKCKFDFNQGDDPNMSCDKENPKCTNYIESKQFGKLGTCFRKVLVPNLHQRFAFHFTFWSISGAIWFF